MRKILILTSAFLPEPDANGINVNIVGQELINRGYDVTCISYRKKSLLNHEIINGLKIYRVSPSFFYRIMDYDKRRKNNIFMMLTVKTVKVLRKIKLGLLFINFPDFDILQKYNLYFIIKKMIKKNKYDMIIGVYKPYSNISALLKIKHDNPEILCGAYCLDLINSQQRPTIMPRKVYAWLCEKSDLKVFNNLDFSLVAKAGEKMYTDKKFNSVGTKINYVDFPTFQVSDEIDYLENYDEENGEDNINLIYAGTLDKNYRNPKYLLDILNLLTQFGITINFNIYGRGNCDEILSSYSGNSKLRINNRGFEDSAIIRKKMLKADFVVNISNEINSAVPSKIFELFSTGKPILNVVTNKNDITNSYFDKYPSVFFIDNKSDMKTQINALYNYIISEKSKKYDVKMIAENFKENTPGYTVDIIESYLNKIKVKIYG